jgi:hypothetical protein
MVYFERVSVYANVASLAECASGIGSFHAVFWRRISASYSPILYLISPLRTSQDRKLTWSDGRTGERTNELGQLNFSLLTTS